MSFEEAQDGVLFARHPLVGIDAEHLEELKRSARRSPKSRARICAHQDEEANIHEMIIAQTSSSYIRPHKHLGRSESMHVIDGTFDLVMFDDEGNVTEAIEMGPPGSGRRFYVRINEPRFHTLVIQSPEILVHETTQGPFDPDQTEYAPWAPPDEEPERIEDWQRTLAAAVENAKKGSED